MKNLALSLLLLVCGCGLADVSVGAGPAEPGTTSARVDAFAATCTKYPLTFQADPATEWTVRGAAAKHWPGSSVQFAAARGTPSLITGIDGPLRPCVGKERADGPVRDFLAAHAEIFQVDAAEWVWEDAPSCDVVAGWSSPEYVTVRRTTEGGHPLADQQMVLRIGKGGDFAAVSMFVGHYTQPSSAIAAQMAGCVTRSDAELEKVLLLESYPFSTFNYCVPTGSGTYAPNLSDVPASVSKDRWYHEDDGTKVSFTLRRDATLTVDASNWTKELLASDAACTQPLNVGFSVRLDAVQGAVVDKRPGIGCIVCLQ